MSNVFAPLAAVIIAVLFCSGIIWAVLNTNWQISDVTPAAVTTAGLADRLFSENGFILPVEIIPTVLLATIIGAIVLIKDKKK